MLPKIKNATGHKDTNTPVATTNPLTDNWIRD